MSTDIESKQGAKIKLINSSILEGRERRGRTMFVNKLHIGCSVACAQGNKQRNSATSLCYFCSGDADLFSCQCILQKYSPSPFKGLFFNIWQAPPY